MFCSCAPLPEVLRCSPRGNSSFFEKGFSGSVMAPDLKVKLAPSPSGQNWFSMVPLAVKMSSSRRGMGAASTRLLKMGRKGASAALEAAAPRKSLRRRSFIVDLLEWPSLRKRAIPETAALLDSHQQVPHPVAPGREGRARRPQRAVVPVLLRAPEGVAEPLPDHAVAHQLVLGQLGHQRGGVLHVPQILGQV